MQKGNKNVFFFKQKTAYEMRISDWSSDVCSSDLNARVGHVGDSRIYHLRGSGLVTRTKDQTEVQHLIDEGILTPERAKMYPRKNVLLSAISRDRKSVV